MAKLVYVPPPKPIPFAIPIVVTSLVLALQLGRIGFHVLRGPGAVAEGHSHILLILAPPVLAGLLSVWAVRLLGRRIRERYRAPRVTRTDFVGTVLVLSAVTGVIGLRLGIRDLRGVRPMVLIDLGRVVSAAIPAGSDSTVPARLLVGATRSDTLTLLGRPLRLEKDSTSLTLAALDGVRRLTIPLPALEMPQQVEIVPVRAAAEPVAFALLVTGSARSNQAMFAVVDSTWRLLLLERMYRRWPAAPRVLSLQRDSVTNFDILLVARAEADKTALSAGPGVTWGGPECRRISSRWTCGFPRGT